MNPSLNTTLLNRDILDAAISEMTAANTLDNAPQHVAFSHPVTKATITFTEESARSIPPLDLLNTKEPLLFVDGGSAILCETPQICLALLRFAALRYQGLERQERILHECFVVVNSQKGVQYFNKPPFFRDFSPTHSSHENGEHLDLQETVNSVRRFQELNLVNHLKKNYPQHTVVFDGSFDAENEGEQELLKELQNSANQTIGFSKSSHLLTQEGKGLIDELNRLLKTAEIKDPAIFCDDMQTIFFVKLHRRSPTLFRIDASHSTELNADVQNRQDKMHKILEILSYFAQDAAFLGYPYPLLEVDRCARVTNAESCYYRSRIAARLDISALESSISAHSVLDKMSF